MIVQGTGLDRTGRMIGVSPDATGFKLWQVAIDGGRVGPFLRTQDEAEAVARWLRDCTSKELAVIAPRP